MNHLVDVYPYCWQQQKGNLLLLKGASDVMYAGRWRMIGGLCVF